MKLYFLIVKVVIIAALLIISNGNLALIKPENRQIFWNEYRGWLSQAFDHTVYITGYMVRSEWLPDAPKGQGTAFERFIGLNNTKR